MATPDQVDEEVWKRIVEILQNNKHMIPMSLSKNLNILLSSRESLSTKLQEFAEDIRVQEIAVNLVKTVGTTGTVIGTILLFTPFAPLGAGITVASTAGLASTSLGDWIADQVKDSNLKEMLKRDEELACRFIEDMKKIDALAAAFLNERVMKTIEEGQKYAFTFTLLCIVKGAGILANAIQLYKPLKALFVDGFKLINKSSLGFVSLSLGSIVAVLCIIDCVLSWITVNPNREKAEKAKKLIDGTLTDLKRMKDIIDRFAESKKGA